MRLKTLGLFAFITLLAGGCAHQPTDKTDDRLAIDPDSVPDAVPRAEPRSRSGNPDTYVVFGKRYSTLPASTGFVERGVASWYGEDFHGKRASNGEPYDMFAMTAAHKALPLPTYARVTNLENGRSVVVRVNDRGPFVGDRVIDLSWVAAAKLRLANKGTGMVEVRAIDPEDPNALPPAQLDTGTRLAAATPERPPSPSAPAAKKAEPNISKPDPIALLAAHSPPRSGATAMAQKGAAGSSSKPNTVVAMAGKTSSASPSTAATAPKTAGQPSKQAPGSVSPASKPAAQPSTPAAGSVAAAKPAQSGPAVVAKPPQPASKAAGERQTLYVQLGAFSTRENADRLRERVAKSIDKSVRVDATKADGHSVHRVRVGPVGSASEAQLLATRLASLGVSGAKVVVD